MCIRMKALGLDLLTELHALTDLLAKREEELHGPRPGLFPFEEQGLEEQKWVENSREFIRIQ